MPMRAFATLILAALLTAYGFAQNQTQETTSSIHYIPVVRTGDLSAILNGKDTTTSRLAPSPQYASIHSEFAKWDGEEGKEMARIAALPQMTLDWFGGGQSTLRDLLRMICDNAGMPNFILGDDPIMSTPVSLTGTRHPWEFLQALANTYNLEVVYRNHIWHIYPLNSSELVVAEYVLKYNTLERFKASSSSSRSTGQPNSSPNYQSGEGKSNNGGLPSNNQGTTTSIDRTTQSVYEIDSSDIVKQASEFLEVAPSATLASSNTDLGIAGPRLKHEGQTQQTKGFVKFISDTNTLYVLATRKQHALIARWIASLDQPIPQIVIETKFLLTTVNPTSHIGTSNPLFDDNLSVTMSDITNEEVNPGKPASWKMPKAVMTASDLTARLSLLESMSNTSTVQYPQQTTLSGREVVLGSLKQIPIESSRSVGLGNNTGSLNSSVEYMDIGTTVSIIAKVFNKTDILLNITIQVSSATDSTKINGNSYPVPNTQYYRNQVIISNGCSLALGGLEQAVQSSSSKSIPLLGNIPFFGFLFKDLNKSNTRSVLSMIVTPTIMPSYSGGNTKGTGQFTIPTSNAPKRLVFNGDSKATIEDVQLSLAGFTRDIEEIEQISLEGRGDSNSSKSRLLLINELKLMITVLDKEKAKGRDSTTARAEIKAHLKRLNAISF